MRDLTSPSIATLTDILECLGTDLGSFFNEAVDNKIVFKSEDIFVKETEDNYIINWIVPNAQKYKMEPILVELKAAVKPKPTSLMKGKNSVMFYPGP